PDLLGLVQARIGADLRGWTFEVVESAALVDGSGAVTALRGLRDHGAQTAIDDFGTGYSGVLSLKSFGFGVVKLDRAFLDEVGPGSTLLGAMSDMAHALGAVTVGEGVEDEVQVQTLRGLGVDMLQGFHIARPMPGPEATAWLAGAMA
ncbi:MAG TPA: EAL domain-containing protein, partial [Actinotalea sp.]|nr:EAL domain-containing protein [Actinotalea sp.]